MYKRSIETRSRNRCCCAKAICIHILSVWYVALVIQHVKSMPILNCQILIKLKFSQQIFDKYLTIKYRENPSSGSRVFPCGRTKGLTDMMKIIVAFRNFANAPKE